MSELALSFGPKKQYGQLTQNTTWEKLGIPDGDYEALGRFYTHAVMAFEEGEKAARKAAVPVEHKDAPVATSEAAPMAKPAPKAEDFESEEEYAKAILEAGVGPTTKLPWEGDVKAEPKPWQKSGKIKATEDIDTDGFF